MSLDVGQRIDDPYAYRNRYSGRRVATTTLADGTVEEEFRSGYGGECRVFFRLDNVSQKIVSWRYEGTEYQCMIRP
jgi:hypothetical protein